MQHPHLAHQHLKGISDATADPLWTDSSPVDPFVSVLSVALGLAIPAAGLALLCSCLLLFVPVVGLVMLPAAGLSFLALCYAITGLAYARLAQADPPSGARRPFFSASLPRNFALAIRIIGWSIDFVTLGARLGLQWCIREVVVSRSKEEIVTGPISYAPGHVLTLFRPPSDAPQTHPVTLRPVVILLPPVATPLSARARDVLTTLAGHQLRLTPALVVVPSAHTFPTYPAAQLEQSVAHTRELLHWVAENVGSFGGDSSRIFVIGHGAAGVVAVWAGGLRDAIVKSKESFLIQRWRRKQGLNMTPSDGEDDDKFGEERDGAPDLSELDGDGVEEVPNGLRMVEVWGDSSRPLPQIEGVILLSAPTDIPLQVRHEASLYIEHLAYTRRFFGPAHVQCMLASPSFCLYAAKAVIDINYPQMIKRWLLVHGGKDEIVLPQSSVMMSELLSGVGLKDVQLRAYRDMAHYDSLLALARGANNHYAALVMRDIRSFVYPSHLA